MRSETKRIYKAYLNGCCSPRSVIKVYTGSSLLRTGSFGRLTDIEIKEMVNKIFEQDDVATRIKLIIKGVSYTYKRV
jgi:hypothetical protein